MSAAAPTTRTPARAVDAPSPGVVGGVTMGTLTVKPVGVDEELGVGTLAVGSVTVKLSLSLSVLLSVGNGRVSLGVMRVSVTDTDGSSVPGIETAGSVTLGSTASVVGISCRALRRAADAVDAIASARIVEVNFMVDE